jgi:hypothetical protein
MARIDLFDTEETRYLQDHQAMRGYMGQSFRVAVNQHKGDHTKALAELHEGLQRDRRFDAFDKQRLLDRFSKCYQDGSYLDFNDEGLKPGGRSQETYLKTSSRLVESPPIRSYRIPRT